jgi:hypothetical protein
MSRYRSRRIAGHFEASNRAVHLGYAHVSSDGDHKRARTQSIADLGMGGVRRGENEAGATDRQDNCKQRGRRRNLIGHRPIDANQRNPKKD